MTRARELARLANENVFTAEDYNSPVEVGINSTSPSSTLDVRGDLKVGTAIQAGTAGVVTATEFSGSIGTFSGAGSFGGNLDVTGNVTIGGTLTYEDVTNIDSVGLVTARSGLRVTAGGVVVTAGVTTITDDLKVNSTLTATEGLNVTAGVTTIAGTSTFAKKTTVNATLEATEGLNVTAGVTTIAGAATLAQLTTVSSQLNVGSNIKAGSAGVVTATTFVGALTGTASGNAVLTGSTNNQIVTVTGANAIQGETKLTYSGSLLDFAINNNGQGFKIGATGNHIPEFIFDANRTGANDNLGRTEYHWNGTEVAAIAGIAGADTTNKDDGQIKIQTRPSGGSLTERLRLDSAGDIDIKGGDVSFSQQNNSTNTANGSILFSNSATSQVSRISGFTGSSNDDGDLRFYTKNGGTETEALRISQHSSPKLQLLAGECEIVPSATDGSLLFRADPGQNRSGSNIAFEVDATERARIDADGKLGINTTNTGGGYLGAAVNSSSTNVLATGAIALNLKNLNTTDNTWVSMDFNNSVGGIVGRIGAQFKDTSDKDTDIYFATRADGGSLAERLRITSNGDFGTGGVTPTAQSGRVFHLHAGAAQQRFHMTNDTTGSGATDGFEIIVEEGTDTRIRNFEAGDMALDTGGSNNEVMRLGSYGEIKFKNSSITERMHYDSGGGIQGDYNHDTMNYGMIWFGATNPVAAWTMNIRGSGSVAFNDLMDNGTTTTFTQIAASSNASYYMTAFKIDGTTQTVEWAGGSAPSAATGSGFDSYVITIFKSASNTYKCFGNFTNFN